MQEKTRQMLDHFNVKNKGCGCIPYFLKTIIFFGILASNIITLNAQDKSNWRLGFNFELVKRVSNLYYKSDTVLNEAILLKDIPRDKQIYQNVSFKLYKRINEKSEIESRLRIKLYGIKELFLTTPVGQNYNILGFSGRQLMGDYSINYTRNYFGNSAINISPTVGLTFFFPIVYAKDSNIYQNFGEIEFMSYYRAPKLKLGYNLGIEIEKKIGKSFLFSLNANYYSPFINNYVSLGSVRATDTHRYWYKWQKKINGIYFGAGFKYILTRRN